MTLSKVGKYFSNIRVVSTVLASFVITIAFAGNAYTDYKLEKYITVAALNTYMIKKDVQGLLRRIEYLKLDLRNATTSERQTINDKISLIETQIRQVSYETP